MNHLGTWVSALADGQLDPAATERALAHVASCSLCAAQLRSARAARNAISTAHDVAPTADLTARLLSLAPSEQSREPVGRMDPFLSPSSRAPHATWAGTSALTGEVAPRPSSRKLVVRSLAGVGVLAAVLFVLGDRPLVAPSDEPSESLALLSRIAAVHAEADADRTGQTTTIVARPGVDYLQWLRDNGWTCPNDLPADWSIAAVRAVGQDAVELELTGPTSSRVVTERHGQLDPDAVAAAERLALEDRTLYVLSTSPWHAAWQSGDTVVEVVAASSSGDLTSVVAGFPSGQFDNGLPARITRGWGTVTQAISWR